MTTHNDRWVILCPGPSLQRLENAQAVKGLNDHLVAVNGAILVAGALADTWVLQDPEVLQTAFLKMGADAMIELAKKTTLWTHHNFVHTIWERRSEFASPLAFLVRFSFHMAHIPNNASPQNFEALLGVSIDLWREYSFFWAIALAVLSGAKNIDVFGADLCASGYFDNAFINVRTDHTIRRWTRERTIYEETIAPAVRNAGINLRRHEL